ncbi:MAG: NTP transferase domain-containing protein [Desulfurococcales archaeon]|nr:NTP transferase domain-containing protein [Desulfurococcales archaeon]
MSPEARAGRRRGGVASRCPASCLVMAGGRGERLWGPSKPLVDVCGEPMILRVARALARSGVCPFVAIAYSPRSRAVLSLPWEEVPASIVFIETLGAGYPEDMPRALQELPQPTLVVPADMPHLTPRLVARIAERLCSTEGDIVNLVGPRGLTGISLHRRRTPTDRWANVELEGVEEWRLIDVDTPGDLEEARRRCA